MASCYLIFFMCCVLQAVAMGPENGPSVKTESSDESRYQSFFFFFLIITIFTRLNFKNVGSVVVEAACDRY